MPSFGLISYLKLTGIVAVLAVIGLGYWHYRAMEDEILHLRSDLVSALTDARRAKSAVDALEQVAAEKEAIATRSVGFQKKLTTLKDDIEIPPDMAAPFLERFGASK